jgi:outer membrane protein assembly factor BamB
MGPFEPGTPLAAAGSPAKGDWPRPRQNGGLTAHQPLPGRINSAPRVVAELSFARRAPLLRPISVAAGGEPDRAVQVTDGKLVCWSLVGKKLWESHPPGLNFSELVGVEDLNADGKHELILTAGRPKEPLAAAVVLDAETGALKFRYDVEPMSYWWRLLVDDYLPGRAGKQMIVCMQGYPPDKKFGYLALFDWEQGSPQPRQRWRYDFHDYTCMPSFMRSDVNGDGVAEFCVCTHSRMWVVDPRDGKIVQFIKWEVAPANIRSYGLTRFVDLNGDGREDFLCIADFSQHHEVLLNENGVLKQAWHHGWSDNVTTRKIATNWCEPPVADVDRNGRSEVVLSMFNATAEPRWMIRTYDAVTGELRSAVRDRIAMALADVDGDGKPELLAEISSDPNRAACGGMCLLKWTPDGAGGNWQELWRDEAARPAALPPARRRVSGSRLRNPVRSEELQQALLVTTSTGVRRLAWGEGRITLAPYAPPAPPSGPDLSRIPARGGASLSSPLVADLDGDGRNEVVHYHQGKVTLYRWEGEPGLVAGQTYESDGEPGIADLDGDGRLELVLGRASAGVDPVVRAVRPADGRELWVATLPRPNRAGVPFGRPLYFVTGRFLGRKGADVYVYVGTPLVRSLVLNGETGAVVWERGEVSEIGRHYAPTQNLAAVHDVDGDGRDDLVFTAPDYYCVASGPTGKDLVSPAFPPKIFSQPSQGLYTFPAVLERANQEALVCLVDGHYFRAGMTARAAPLWYQLPEVGEARSGAEGFLPLADGTWLMGYGREDGRFVCVDAATGKQRWDLAVDGSASGVTTCDIDGDGKPEFLFGTSHGELLAVRDEGVRPRVVWRTRLPTSVGQPIAADLDEDGKVELLVTTGDGRILLLRG